MSDAAAVTGYATLSKVLKDGTIRFIVDVQPEWIEAFGSIYEPETPVFLVRRNTTITPERPNEEKPKADDVGEFWRKVHASGVIPAIVRTGALGSDSEYLAWLRTRKCHNCRADPPCEAAHVRRVHHGAGTGIKPPYAAVALCRSCHSIQHANGESALYGNMESWLADDLLQFGRYAMKKAFGAESAKDIPIDVFRAICEENGVRL